MECKVLTKKCNIEFLIIKEKVSGQRKEVSSNTNFDSLSRKTCKVPKLMALDWRYRVVSLRALCPLDRLLVMAIVVEATRCSYIVQMCITTRFLANVSL